jgi:hypothetical protein
MPFPRINAMLSPGKRVSRGHSITTWTRRDGYVVSTEFTLGQVNKG